MSNSKLPLSSTIRQFCDRYNINPATYYRRVKKGLAPPYKKIGRSSLILEEDERQWREQVRNGELGADVSES